MPKSGGLAVLTALVGLLFLFVEIAALPAILLTPNEADAIPAFARRYETSCRTCHEYHFPRLNSFGRQFRENGLQLADGAEDPVRAQRNVEPGTAEETLTIFRELPFSFRGQVFGVARPDSGTQPSSEFSLFSFLMGGGSIAEDVSFFFSWTPFLQPMLHKARVGIHNLGSGLLGDGTLNVQAGQLMLLDFQRPSHRFLAPGPSVSDEVAVGLNGFMLGNPTLGAQVYGRPNHGPFFYELAVVAGDPGTGLERDDWKDLFARLTYTLFQHTDHELTIGTLGYLGRSEIETQAGGILVTQQDDFWMAGGELEFYWGPFSLFGMGLYGSHSDALLEGGTVDFLSYRVETLVAVSDDITASARFEQVISNDLTTLDQTQLGVSAGYTIATNFLANLAWRFDVKADTSDVVIALDAVF